MNIGHARRKITPQGDIYLIGYRNLPNRLEPATGVHDDVFANAILFQQDDREVFLFNADVLEFGGGAHGNRRQSRSSWPHR